VAHACNLSDSGGLQFKANPRQIVCETLSRKHPSQRKGRGVAQGVGPEFKPQYCKKEKKKKNLFFLERNVRNNLFSNDLCQGKRGK
jgi:hypothetical protein